MCKSVSAVVLRELNTVCLFQRKITFPHKFRTVFRAVDHSIVFYTIWLRLLGWCLFCQLAARAFVVIFFRHYRRGRCRWFSILYFAHINAHSHTYINQIEKGNGTNLYPSVIRRASIVELHSTCAIVCACVHVKLTTVCLDSVLCPCYSFIKITSGTLWMLGVLPPFFLLGIYLRISLLLFFAETPICIFGLVVLCRRWFSFFTFSVFVIMIFFLNSLVLFVGCARTHT